MIEIREGRGCGEKGDYVYLKLDHLGEDVLKTRLPGISELAKTFAGVDVTKEPIPVVPTCHYMMGGIPTNIHGAALTLDKKGNDQAIEGLFAAGECACVSVHGANRLGANSLLDIVVFGRAVGLYLEESLNNGTKMPDVSQDDIDQALQRYRRFETNKDGERVYDLRAELQNVMQEDFGVFRDAEPMAQGLQKLRALGERIEHAVLDDHSKVFNTARIEALELDNLWSVAVSSAALANERKESRGAHSRLDCPDRDDKHWLKHLVYFADDVIGQRPVNMQPVDVETLQPKERDN